MEILIICLALLSISQDQLPDDMNEIRKNNMSVKWEIEKEFIRFEMQAPTKGWVAIGFNENESLSGAYLLMGHIKEGKVEVVEYYTERAGSYQPIQNYGVATQVKTVNGSESGNNTLLEFSIPVNAISKYHKELLPKSEWTLIMAYSLDDDFQHHSIMRTSAKIKL